MINTNIKLFKLILLGLFFLALVVFGYSLLPKSMCIGCEQTCTNFEMTTYQLEKMDTYMRKELIKNNDKVPDKLYKNIVGKYKDAWNEPLLIKINTLDKKGYILYSKGWNRLNNNNEGDDISLNNKDKMYKMYCINCEKNNMSC